MAVENTTVATTYGINVADRASLILPVGAWAIAGWFRLATQTYPYPYLISTGGYGVNNSFNIYIGAAPAELKLYWKSATESTGDALLASSVAFDSVWRLLTLNYDGTNLRTYFDSTLKSTIAITTTTTTTVSGGQMSLLRNTGGFINRSSNGAVAEWAKWDRALTDDERAALVAGYSPAFFPNGRKWYLPLVRI